MIVNLTRRMTPKTVNASNLINCQIDNIQKRAKCENWGVYIDNSRQIAQHYVSTNNL